MTLRRPSGQVPLATRFHGSHLPASYSTSTSERTQDIERMIVHHHEPEHTLEVVPSAPAQAGWACDSSLAPSSIRRGRSRLNSSIREGPTNAEPT